MMRRTFPCTLLLLLVIAISLLQLTSGSVTASESELTNGASVSIGPAGVPVPISPISILSTRKGVNQTDVLAATSKPTPITSSTPSGPATPAQAKPSVLNSVNPAVAAAAIASLPAVHDAPHPSAASSPGAPLPAPPSAAALAASSSPSIADIEGVEEVDTDSLDDDSSDKDDADSDSSSSIDDDVKAPDEDAKIAQELAAHEAHMAEHADSEAAEQAAHDKEHQDNSHSTHEVDAVALHHGVITTNADAQTIHAADLKSASSHPAAAAGALPGTEGKSEEIRNSARLLLRKLAAERVAQAKQAVRAAVHRQRFAQAYSNGGIDVDFNGVKKSPDLVEVDHSHDDEPDDDVGRDKALLKFAMDQMVHASRKKSNEIEELLDALKGAASANHNKKEKETKDELEELAKEKHELQVEKEELEAKEKAATNWTLWILLSIGLLCLCIAIPIVWTYWMKTWIVQQATGLHPALAGGNNPNVAYRSINAVGGNIEAVSPYDDDLLIVDEDGNSYDASHPSRHALRFETRKKTPIVQQPRVVVVKKVPAVATGSASPASSRGGNQSQPRRGAGRKTAAHATHAANFPEFDPHADENQSDSYGENEEEPALSPTSSHVPPGRKSNKSNRPPPAARINPDELSDGEDLAEEASMIGSARY